MKRKRLELGPSKVAVDAHRRKGGIHDDQKTNHRRDRQAVKVELAGHEHESHIDLRDLLVSAIAEGVDVTVTVDEGQTQCCGGGWRHWDGERGPLTRRGRVVKVENGVILLHSHELGRITQLLAELADVTDVTVL